jgi:hypothetical protein
VELFGALRCQSAAQASIGADTSHIWYQALDARGSVRIGYCAWSFIILLDPRRFLKKKMTVSDVSASLLK